MESDYDTLMNPDMKIDSLIEKDKQVLKKSKDIFREELKKKLKVIDL